MKSNKISQKRRCNFFFFIKIDMSYCIALQVEMSTGRDGHEFRYLILISVKKNYPHPHTQTQLVSNFCLILIPIG